MPKDNERNPPRAIPIKPSPPLGVTVGRFRSAPTHLHSSVSFRSKTGKQSARFGAFEISPPSSFRRLGHSAVNTAHPNNQLPMNTLTHGCGTAPRRNTNNQLPTTLAVAPRPRNANNQLPTPSLAHGLETAPSLTVGKTHPRHARGLLGAPSRTRRGGAERCSRYLTRTKGKVSFCISLPRKLSKLNASKARKHYTTRARLHRHILPARAAPHAVYALFAASVPIRSDPRPLSITSDSRCRQQVAIRGSPIQGE